jgi:hypothetical protein
MGAVGRAGVRGETNRWLVVVYPAAEESSELAVDGDGQPRVSWVTADDARDAAEIAGVKPGEHAEVCNEADVFWFKRPKQAALIPGEVL